MIATSRISGTSVIVVVPGASSAAAISLSTLFFAPGTVTSPASRAPPVTTNLSTSWTLGLRHARTCPGPAPAAPPGGGLRRQGSPTGTSGHPDDRDHHHPDTAAAPHRRGQAGALPHVRRQG